MPEIFISYRRKSGGPEARLLAQHLEHKFGLDSIFLDVESIEPGINWLATVQTQIASADLVIAVIDEQWNAATSDDGLSRLHDKDDAVRMELSLALLLQKRIIPVLFDSAEMPDPDLLPENLQQLCNRNAILVRNTHFDQDISRLDNAVETLRKDPWHLLRFIEDHSHKLSADYRLLYYVLGHPWRFFAAFPLGLLLICDLALVAISADPETRFRLHASFFFLYFLFSICWAFDPIVYVGKVGNRYSYSGIPFSYSMLGGRSPWIAPTVTYSVHLINLILLILMMPMSSEVFIEVFPNPHLHAIMLANALLVGSISYWWRRRSIDQEKREFRTIARNFVRQHLKSDESVE